MKLEYTITPDLYREYAYKVRYKYLLILGSILSLIEFILGIYNRDFLTILLSIINILIFFSLPIIFVKLYFLIKNHYLHRWLILLHQTNLYILEKPFYLMLI